MLFTDTDVAEVNRDRFWRSMPSDLYGLCNELESNGLLLLPTGSRVICPDHATDQSDWDIVVPGEIDWRIFGFDRNEAEEDDEDKYPDDRNSPYGCWRLGQLNIVSVPWNRLERWAKATDFCMSDPRATTREYRVKAFQLFKV